jgi:hypothetical protein
MVQARIRKNGIEFVVDFEDEKDLEQKISKIDFTKATDLLSKKFELTEQRTQVMNEFVDLYTINNGQIQLLKYPKKDRDTIKLLLFLVPEGLTPPEIRKITGISNPQANMPDTDFLKIGNKFTLQADAKKYVISTLIPSLRGQKT